MNKTFDFCNERCVEFAEMGNDLMVSSSDTFDFCAICGHYGNTSISKEFEVKFVEEEKCDCYEKYGKIQHNDGGNYHITFYSQVSRCEHQWDEIEPIECIICGAHKDI